MAGESGRSVLTARYDDDDDDDDDDKHISQISRYKITLDKLGAIKSLNQSNLYFVWHRDVMFHIVHALSKCLTIREQGSSHGVDKNVPEFSSTILLALNNPRWLTCHKKGKTI